MMVAWLTMYMVQKPPKYDDVICEQPLTKTIFCFLHYYKRLSKTVQCTSNLKKVKKSDEKIYTISFIISVWPAYSMIIRMFLWTTICRGDNYTGKNFVPPIKTRSPVVKAVKLMAWRQTKSPLKITTWSCGQRLASQIS